MPHKYVCGDSDEDESPTIGCREIEGIACALATKERVLLERERLLNERLIELQDYNKNCRLNINGSEIQQKACALAAKEQELLKRERQVTQKLNKLTIRQDVTVKKQLQAASKLKLARRQLLLALDARDKVEKLKIKKHHKKKSRKKSREQKLNFTSKVFNCLLKPPSTRKKKSKVKLLSFFKRLIGKSCNCMMPRANKKFGPFSQRFFGVLPCLCPLKSPVAHRSRWAAAAGDCYLMSLRNPPHPWLYHRWPRFYPPYLSLRHQWRNLGYVLLFLAGIVFWTPLILCMYLCICLCCSDC